MESPALPVAIQARPRRRRSTAKRRSKPEQARYSGRSREAYLVRKQEAELRAALDLVEPINPLMTAAIRRAAELHVIAADLRAKHLRGEPVDITAIVRAENAHRRALEALGITTSVKREPDERPQLSDWLRRTKRGAP